MFEDEFKTGVCSACGQPYTKHAIDCPHLLAVEKEGAARQKLNKLKNSNPEDKENNRREAEEITAEFKQEVESGNVDAESQMEDIIDGQNDNIDDYKKWDYRNELGRQIPEGELIPIRQSIEELIKLYEQAEEIFNSHKSWYGLSDPSSEFLIDNGLNFEKISNDFHSNLDKPLNEIIKFYQVLLKLQSEPIGKTGNTPIDKRIDELRKEIGDADELEQLIFNLNITINNFINKYSIKE